MSVYNDNGRKAFTAGEAIPQYSRVKISSGKVVVAGVGDKDIGIAETPAFALGDVITVVLRTKPGTFIAIANGAVTAGAAVHTAASGKVSATAATGSFPFGTSLETVTADGHFMEVLRNTHGDTAAS